jgi:hypothetical protein
MRPSRIFLNTKQEAVNAIETSSEIPIDAKAAIKDFIRENFEALQEQAADLINFPIPDSIADNWQIIVEILQRIFGIS